MDFTSSKTNWIWAVKKGDAIKSSAQDYSGLDQHDSEDSFTWDLTVAKGGNSLNPFSTQAAASGTASSASSPTSTATSGSSGSGSYGASSGGPSGDELSRMRARTAHGAIMGLAFALFFPLGSILIRIFSFSGLIWVHAAAQLFAYALSVVGLGLGIYIATGPYRRTVRLGSPPLCAGGSLTPTNRSAIAIPFSACWSSACSCSSRSSASSTTTSSSARIVARSGPPRMSGSVACSSRSASSTAVWASSSARTRPKGKLPTGWWRGSCG